MKLCWCTLMVSNLENSVKFYRDMAGMPVIRRFPVGPDMEICFLGEGETKVELICDRKFENPAGLCPVSLGFEVSNLEEKIEFLAVKGIKPLPGGIIQPNPHLRFFFVKDPDGYRVQFVQNL